MEQPPLFVVILEEGRAYTSLGKSSWNLLLMEHCGVSQGRQRVPVSSEALERNTSLGLEKMPPLAQDSQLSNVTGGNPAGIPATSP